MDAIPTPNPTTSLPSNSMKYVVLSVSNNDPKMKMTEAHKTKGCVCINFLFDFLKLIFVPFCQTCLKTKNNWISYCKTVCKLVPILQKIHQI